MDTPFLGSEAVAAGLVAKHQLRNHRGPFVTVFPDVYTRRSAEMTIRHRAKAAWLWSHRGGVLAGVTASALHGAQYVEDTLPIELVWPNRRPPRGITTSEPDRLPPTRSRSTGDFHSPLSSGRHLTSVGVDIWMTRSPDSMHWEMPRDFVSMTYFG